MQGKKREEFDSLTGNVCPLRVHLDIHGTPPHLISRIMEVGIARMEEADYALKIRQLPPFCS